MVAIAISGVALVLAVAGVAGLFRYGMLVVHVRGVSMMPTLHEADRVLALRGLLSRRLRRGDIVIIHPPLYKSQKPVAPGFPDHGPPMVKRLVGLPGDEVGVGDAIQKVPVGHVWVRGDSSVSFDSDTYGPLPEGRVIARVIAELPHPRVRPSNYRGESSRPR